jgi:hypothetical protein
MKTFQEFLIEQQIEPNNQQVDMQKNIEISKSSLPRPRNIRFKGN